MSCRWQWLCLLLLFLRLQSVRLLGSLNELLLYAVLRVAYLVADSFKTLVKVLELRVHDGLN